LLRECWAMAEQPRALDRNRIGEGPLTRLSEDEMDALEQALRAGLGLAGGCWPLQHRPDWLQIKGNPLCHPQVATFLFPLQLLDPA
jgi:hypothetical protein